MHSRTRPARGPSPLPATGTVGTPASRQDWKSYWVLSTTFRKVSLKHGLSPGARITAHQQRFVCVMGHFT